MGGNIGDCIIIGKGWCGEKVGGDTELDRSLMGLMLPDLKLSSLTLLGDNLSLRSGLTSCWVQS